MKKIKQMIETAFTKKEAIDMLKMWKTFGSISSEEYDKGRKIIDKEFNNRG